MGQARRLVTPGVINGYSTTLSRRNRVHEIGTRGAVRTRELSTEHTEIIQEVFPQRVSLTGQGSRVKEEPPKEGAAAKGAPASANGRCKGPGVMKTVVEERPTSG